MPLDPSIALSVKPFNVDLGTIYNNLAAQRQAEQTQQLNALKLQEAQQAQVTSNALRQLNPNAPDYITQVTQISPALGMQLHKERAAAEASGAQTAERRAAAAKTQGDIIAQEFRNISADPSDANVGSLVGRLKASSLFSPQQIAGIEANVQMLLQKPLPERSKFLSQFGATAGELKPPSPVKPQLQQLQEYRATLPEGSAERKAADDAINKLTTHAPAALTTVQLPPQEKSFEAELGKGQADRITKSRAAAEDAAAIIDTVKTGRDIMKSGMIAGTGANFLVNLNQALKMAGIDAGYADAASNSQAFAANMGSNVGKLIKQFGAGTGLSNADREYAEAMAGGKITLDSNAITKILDINEKASRNVIARHNKDVKGIKTNIPLEVEMPPETPVASVMAPPAAAIAYLRSNPTMRGAFDAKYGAGAAERVLGGQ